MSEHKYFRLLDAGEPIQKGDLFYSPSRDKLVPSFNSKAGGTSHFRPVQVDEWIEYAKQKPTKEDFGPTGRIEGEWKDQPRDLFFTWKQFELDCFGGTTALIHWRRITPPTPTVQPVIISNHPVEFNKDGSIKVGCTTVSAEQLDEIIKRRKEAQS